ncbi:hypothetical protein MTO96_007033 [Rhipicephalus appendiculatus]
MDRIYCCLRNAAGVGRRRKTACASTTRRIFWSSERHPRIEPDATGPLPDCEFETSAYRAAPENTSKGLIQGVSKDESSDDILSNLVTSRNPAVLHAKRMGNMGNVIVLFEGFHVPRYEMYGAMLVKCTLYRKHIDVCYCCGRLGHRADVCPNPKDKVCRGCGSKNPAQDHRCEVECQLCGDVAGNGQGEEARAACGEACHNYKEFSGLRNSDHKESMSEQSDKNTNKQDSRHGPERDRSGSFPGLPGERVECAPGPGPRADRDHSRGPIRELPQRAAAAALR